MQVKVSYAGFSSTSILSLATCICTIGSRETPLNSELDLEVRENRAVGDSYHAVLYNSGVIIMCGSITLTGHVFDECSSVCLDLDRVCQYYNNTKSTHNIYLVSFLGRTLRYKHEPLNLSQEVQNKQQKLPQTI